MAFWDALSSLSGLAIAFFFIALVLAFAFEFINGFHDTANAVTTVIYTRSLPARPAVFYSGFLNFLGVLLGGTAVAFGIVNLLPVDLLVEARSGAALVMVLSLLMSGVLWNLGTWYLGLPVSSSHTLIGSILGVGIANGLWNSKGLTGVNWNEVTKVGMALLLSPLMGFIFGAILLLILRVFIRSPRFFQPPVGDDRPPWWIRSVLIATCGGVSYFHGSNDGQKGMGLILLVLIGFLPVHYALTVEEPTFAPRVLVGCEEVRRAFAEQQAKPASELTDELQGLESHLKGLASFEDLPRDKDSRWDVRQHIVKVNQQLLKVIKKADTPEDFRKKLDSIRRKHFLPAVEYVPLWVVIGVAIALGLGTTVGYKRIVITVAEKIGKTHLSYAQGAAAESVAAMTIGLASWLGLSVSTTQVLSSGVAGTMVANRSGVQNATIRKILLAWVFTLPATMLLSGLIFIAGRLISG
jgi:phosphate/sulfate permease